MNETPTTVLRRQQVESRVGLRRSAIYGLMSAGAFPRPIRLGEKSVGWLAHEIDAWLADRISQRDSEGA